jgi:hypothetical protein
MKAMRKFIAICFVAYFWTISAQADGFDGTREIHFSFLGKEYSIKAQNLPEEFPDSHNNPNSFASTIKILDTYCADIIPELSTIRDRLHLSDWHYYQLMRKVSQQLIPKEKDYWGYTYCKWFFLAKSGFNPLLCTIDDKLLLYVKSNSTIYNIPIKMMDQKQYVCMNYHDYNYDIPIEKITPQPIQQSLVENGRDFNYMIANMPDSPEEKYVSKTIEFKYKRQIAKHDIKIFPEVKDYFINYPVTDYRFQFNIPFSKVTYSSLIPSLQLKLKEKTKEEGVEYIMFLVRNAFAYEPDSSIYGREKRFSPEETLVSEWSDCEDHAGLFFSLVREVYNLPMIVLSYPGHINVAVKLENSKRITIKHNGSIYTICEPTPQKKVLYLGQMDKKLSKQPYEVVYEYLPTKS